MTFFQCHLFSLFITHHSFTHQVLLIVDYYHYFKSLAFDQKYSGWYSLLTGLLIKVPALPILTPTNASSHTKKIRNYTQHNDLAINFSWTIITTSHFCTTSFKIFPSHLCCSLNSAKFATIRKNYLKPFQFGYCKLECSLNFRCDHNEMSVLNRN